MNELNRKVFKTIFLILSFFVVFGVIFYNYEIYKNEYESVRRSITFMDDRPLNNPLDPRSFGSRNREIDNMMILDYEVYTVILSDNEVEKIISHSNYESIFDVESIIQTIINKDEGLSIGNLYNSKYAYNYNSNMIIIMNTKSISESLLLTFFLSLLSSSEEAIITASGVFNS